MLEPKDVIKSLKKNDKVMIVYGENKDLFQGYVTEINENNLIIHEYVSDIYRTFNMGSIMEISKI
ncbi:hypothetical protein NSQ59_27510 [Margalitia sp. FSL K6-0131]|uniref:hypothetical protein n=1 Tax=Margalitia sp. FSL K6-0131 TaxID=2954604 RepID=UPI0030FA5B63